MGFFVFEKHITIKIYQKKSDRYTHFFCSFVGLNKRTKLTTEILL
jgi:hypothetical protein